MSAQTPIIPAEDTLFTSYADLASSLLDALRGICLLNEQLHVWGEQGHIAAEAVSRTLRAQRRSGQLDGDAIDVTLDDGSHVIALPFHSVDRRLLGVLAVRLEPTSSLTPQAVAQRLKPLLASLRRELSTAVPRRSKEQTLTERTEELEWLFQVTQTANAASDDGRVITDLLAAATERLDSSLGTIWIADKHLELHSVREGSVAQPLKATFAAARQHLLNWAQRRRRPLVMNNAGAKSSTLSRSKLLAVPIITSTRRVIGVLAFFRSHAGADFGSRQTFLARHLGRQIASLLESQFDLMTGLYTRAALEQAYNAMPRDADVRRWSSTSTSITCTS